MTKNAFSERSYSVITLRDLARLAQIAHRDLLDFSARHKRPYLLDNLICIALCQGAALHYVNQSNGVKDFDVYLFFARGPGKNYPPRVRHVKDFGPSRFGRRAQDKGFAGRRVDVMGRSIPHASGATASESVQRYLEAKNSPTARHLAQKAVVLLEPKPLIGKVIWPT